MPAQRGHWALDGQGLGVANGGAGLGFDAVGEFGTGQFWSSEIELGVGITEQMRAKDLINPSQQGVSTGIVNLLRRKPPRFVNYPL